MINEIKLLTALELRSLYGFNKFRYTKDKKARNRYSLLMLVWVALGVWVIGYIGALVYGLTTFQMAEIVPAYLVMISSLLLFFFGMFKAGHVIFSKKGYDFLCSLPIRSSSVVISRFLSMYVEDAMLTLLIFLPGVIVYGYCIRPGVGFYVTMLWGVFLVPLLPLVLATAIGSLIAAVSSKMRHKTMVQTFLSLIFIVGVLGCPMLGKGNLPKKFSTEMLAGMAETVTLMIRDTYPPAIWLNDAAVFGRIEKFLMFLAVSLSAVVITVIVTAGSFHKISRKLAETSAKHDYRVGKLKKSSVLFALYRREAKRYFSSSIYVTNTMIGPVMACMIAVAVCVVGIDKIRSILPIPLDITGLLPFVLAAVFCMMTATSVAVSMEGKTFWIVKTLPISAKALLDSKLLLNLSLMLPFYLVAEGLLILSIKPGILELLYLISVPVIIALFAVVFGITVNLKLHSFDWEKEEAVVKQSASSLLGCFAGPLLAIVCGGLTVAADIYAKQWENVVKAGSCIVVLIVTIMMYRKNNRTKLVCLDG